MKFAILPDDPVSKQDEEHAREQDRGPEKRQSLHGSIFLQLRLDYVMILSARPGMIGQTTSGQTRPPGAERRSWFGTDAGFFAPHSLRTWVEIRR